jgi:hypothetical protein
MYKDFFVRFPGLRGALTWGVGMYKDFFVRFPGLRGTHVGWYLCSIFRVFGKSTLLRFPGLRGALKGIFWDLECLSGGKFWYFDVGLGGLTYLLFVVSR